MSNRKDMERQFRKLGTRQKPTKVEKISHDEFSRARNIEALKRKIKTQIKDEEKASKIYFDLSVEAKLIDTEIAGEIYRISGEEFIHKTMLEGMYRKLGGRI